MWLDSGGFTVRDAVLRERHLLLIPWSDCLGYSGDAAVLVGTLIAAALQHRARPSGATWEAGDSVSKFAARRRRQAELRSDDLAGRATRAAPPC